MSDGSDSDRDNEPLSALTVKQGKGKSKIVADSSYDKAVKKCVLTKTNEDLMYERLFKVESQLVDAFFRLDQLIPGQIASAQAKVNSLVVRDHKILLAMDEMRMEHDRLKASCSMLLSSTPSLPEVKKMLCKEFELFEGMLHQKIVNAVVQCVTDAIQRQEDAKVAKDIASQIEVDSLLAHLEGGVDNSVHQPQSKKGYFLKRKADDMSGDNDTSGDHTDAKCDLFGITSSELRAPSSASSAAGPAYSLPSEQLSLGPAKSINTYEL